MPPVPVQPTLSRSSWPSRGLAVIEDDHWKLFRDSYCELLAYTGATCPPAGK
jgi:hypothetical protein